MEMKRLHVIRIRNSGTDRKANFENLILTGRGREDMGGRENNGT